MKKFKSLIISYFIIAVYCLTAQNYVPGSSFDVTNVRSYQKCRFTLAGEKFSVVSVTEDTAAKVQIMTVELLNPDFSSFKTMTTQIPQTTMLNMHEGGVKVVENIEDGNAVYYFIYNCMSFNDDWISGNRAVIVREDGVQTGFGYCSWMGFQVADIDGTHKLVADRQAIDTIHYDNEAGSGWYTYQFGTTSVYDVRTGQADYSFPRGIRVSSVEKVDGTMRYFTTSDYLTRSFDPNDPWGKVTAPMAVNHLNADYTPWKSSDGQVAQYTWTGYDLYAADLYVPVVAGSNVYFIHHMQYLNQTNPIDYRTKTFLTDANGTVIASKNGSIFNKFHFVNDEDVCVKRRFDTGDYVLIDYNTVYSLPSLDSICSIDGYTTDASGSLRFLQKDRSVTRILKEDATVYRTIQTPDTSSFIASISWDRYVSDEKLEVSFRDDSTLWVINEDGKTILHQTGTTTLTEFTRSYRPLVMRVQGEKYGRIATLSGSQLIRTMPALVSPLRNDSLQDMPIEAWEIRNGKPALKYRVESSRETLPLSEGSYYFWARSTPENESALYPSELMWEKAKPIVFNTDDTLRASIAVNPGPALLSTADSGTISGIFKSDKVLMAPALKGKTLPVGPMSTEIYIVNAKDNQVVALSSRLSDNYSCPNLPWGTYKVLINRPGTRMGTVHTVVLSPSAPSAVADYILQGDTLIEALNPQAIRTAQIEKGLYPNPATDRVCIRGLDSNAQVRMYDLSGRSFGIRKLSGNTLDVSDLKQGVYLIHYTLDGQEVSERLMKR